MPCSTSQWLELLFNLQDYAGACVSGLPHSAKTEKGDGAQLGHLRLYRQHEVGKEENLTLPGKKPRRAVSCRSLFTPLLYSLFSLFLL